MEAAAKSVLMDCEGCSELLADFLLDELPEAEAVLVHEHLLICPACMKAYRELKGTGRALEAVTAMRPVDGSPAFKTTVREQAKVESEKIVSKLPPDRRLRLEARREARHSVRMSQRSAPPKVWSPGLLFLALTAVVVLAVILFWPKKDKVVPRIALGRLSVAMGKVDQFYKKETQTYTPVEEGKEFLPGESFKTAEHGAARFDLADGGSIFLGPSSDAAFHFPQSEPGECTVVLNENAELGVLRPELSPGANVKRRDWEIRTDAGTLTVAPSTHAYARIIKNDRISTLEVSVLVGCVHAATHDGTKKESLYAGQKATLSSTDSAIVPLSLTDERPPSWRTDLVTTSDLAGLLSGNARILSRTPGQLQIELIYNRETSNQDWLTEMAGVALTSKDGHLNCPTGVRWKHAAMFARPLTFEIKLSADSRRETTFAFGAFESALGQVAVDVTGDAKLSVYEKDKFMIRRDKIAARSQPAAPETLILQLKQEGTGNAATLSTTGGKTKSIPLWKDKPEASGDVWFQAVGEGILLDEVKIAGTLPADWIREKMSGAQ